MSQSTVRFILPCVLLSAPAIVGCHRASSPAPVTTAAARTDTVSAPLALATFDSAWHIIARTHWDTALINARWDAVRDSLRPRAERTTTPDTLRDVLRTMLATLEQSHFAILPPKDTARPTASARDNTTVRDTTPAPPSPPPRGTRVVFGNLPPLYAHLEWERRSVPASDSTATPTRTVGIIRFNIWLPILAREFDVALDSLRTSDAIVLDLRGNSGGVGGMAMGIAGHFVDDTAFIGIMSTRAQTLRFAINPRRVNTANERVTPFAGPLAIIVDARSASTTEIFAAGLQELTRARVFGEQTTGQALPAVAEALPNGDILYHAIANFTTPSGRTIEGSGVTPDEPVAAPADSASNSDPALDAAVRWAARAAAHASTRGARRPTPRNSP